MSSRLMRIIVSGVLCLLTVVAITTAENRPELKFLKSIELPSAGLRFTIMPESRETPIQPPQVFRYTFSQGEKKWNVDMYSPIVLWQTSQYLGRWVDQRSNTLVLAKITTPFPAEKFQQQHVSRENYDKAIADAGNAIIEWNDDDLVKWVTAFSGADKAVIQTVQRPPPHVKTVKSFQLSPGMLGYAFCISRPGPAVGSPITSEWYFAMIILNPKVDFEKAQKSVNSQFLPSISAIKIIQKQTTASSAFQAAAFAGKKQRSPEFLASRKQVADSITNMKDWWYAETDNYIFLSNMKSKHRVIIKELQEHIEYLRDAFEQFMPPRKEITAVSVIRAFASQDEYVAYVGKEHEWSGGLWSPTHKELVIRPIEWGGSKIQRNWFFQCVYHEAFHQYIFYAFDQKRPALWFNEGHAEFYSPATVNQRKFSVLEDPQNVKLLEEMIAGNTADINKLLHMTREEFYIANDKETRRRNYALAWAVVYYLRKGAGLETPPKYANILDKYSEALWATGDGEKATETAFEGIDLKIFQKDFVTFWFSQRKRGAALRNNIFKAYNTSANK
ncbi:MAG: DUF1570 domain-containing protein [Kiritimatiellae bacterium]|nr:DUF1570 domain-containing protein [Kiritimatiellia bacterium]MDD5523182.1 DUF1570 domain-containing protein [Kiritimatiellia bacterium]